ncbi:MAG: hypothetical protein P8N19_02660 [Flavobacteriales bacterium]|nr:hypothetical protein [Flavobacteriales bacterium]MDG1767264.1 hypothetical protein [Flavobacteriales bacterium]
MSPFDFKYDPEDLESLLLHKTFGELYPEEQRFVLQYIDSEEEYNSMRATLLTIQSNDDSPQISARPESKERLMELFSKQNQTSAFRIWLNSTFLPLLAPKNRNLVISFGVMAALVFSVLLLREDESSARLAMLNEKETKDIAFPEQVKEMPSDTNLERSSLNESEADKAIETLDEDATKLAQARESIDLKEDALDFDKEELIANEASPTNEEVSDEMADVLETGNAIALSEDIQIRSVDSDVAVSKVQAESITLSLDEVSVQSHSPTSFKLSDQGSLFSIDASIEANLSVNVKKKSNLIESLYTAY